MSEIIGNGLPLKHCVDKIIVPEILIQQKNKTEHYYNEYNEYVKDKILENYKSSTLICLLTKYDYPCNISDIIEIENYLFKQNNNFNQINVNIHNKVLEIYNTICNIISIDPDNNQNQLWCYTQELFNDDYYQSTINTLHNLINSFSDINDTQKEFLHDNPRELLPFLKQNNNQIYYYIKIIYLSSELL